MESKGDQILIIPKDVLNMGNMPNLGLSKKPTFNNEF